jgi:hypothetical protein
MQCIHNMTCFSKIFFSYKFLPMLFRGKIMLTETLKMRSKSQKNHKIEKQVNQKSTQVVYAAHP